MSKNIVLCCDGTGNEIEANLSNVLKLYRIVRKTDEQVVYYDPGIGTISSSDPWSRLKSNTLGVLGLLTGYGLDENVLDAYQFPSTATLKATGSTCSGSAEARTRFGF